MQTDRAKEGLHADTEAQGSAASERVILRERDDAPFLTEFPAGLQVLEKLGLYDAFPYLRQGVNGGGKLEHVSQNPSSAYLTYVSQLNQVVMMGTQLYHDACVPQHHKYCAHQIALLYVSTKGPCFRVLAKRWAAASLLRPSMMAIVPLSQKTQQCLNMLQGDTKPIRKLVEVRFDEIKQITESRNPILDLELSDWLQEVTWLCREEVKSCPPYIHKRLSTICDIVHSKYRD